MQSRHAAIVIGSLLVLAGSAFGQAPAPDTDGPVYTNKDLEEYEADRAPDPPETPRVEDALAWAEVEKFLTRQYSRIDADREWDLDRRRAESERIVALSVRTRYTLPWAYPYYRYLNRALPYRTPASQVHNGFKLGTPATRAIPGGGRRFGSATGLKGTAAVPDRPPARSRGRKAGR